MKILTFKTEEEWEAARMGKVTGSKLGSIFSKRDKKPIKGFYELIAERVAIPKTGENAMDRGIKLEVEALERFEKETGKKVNKDLVMISRDDNEDIAYSPDGFIGKTETIEVKCLNSASHIEALLTKKVPKEYEMQVLQPFIVNDDLKKLYFVFYDPRMPKDFFYLEVNREEVQKKAEEYLKLEIEALKQVAAAENELTF